MHGQVPRDLALRTLHAGDAKAQGELTFSNLGGVLRAAGATWNDVVHIRVFCKNRDDVATMRDIRTRFLPPGACAVTELVADYFDPLLLVEIELVVLRPPG
jgi:2-iminobutanoate/2-iminopropanoate deaminase